MQSANTNKNKQKRIDVHRQLNDKYRLNISKTRTKVLDIFLQEYLKEKRIFPLNTRKTRRYLEEFIPHVQMRI